MKFLTYLNERYVTAFKDDMNLYADEVYNMLVNAYKKIGGIKGISSKEDLIKDSDIWKMVRRNGKIIACQVYSTKRGGRKAIGGATDGTEIGKQAMYDIMKEDIKMKDRSAWAEVSGGPLNIR